MTEPHLKLDCASCKKCCVIPGDIDRTLWVNIMPDEEEVFGHDKLYFETPVAGGHACEYLGDTGCVLPIPKRPLACRVFPLIPIVDGGFLVSKFCPKFDTAKHYDVGKLEISPKQRERFSRLVGSST